MSQENSIDTTTETKPESLGEDELKTFPNRERARAILKQVLCNQRIIDDHPGCDCEEAWRPIEKELDKINTQQTTETKPVTEAAREIVEQLFDYDEQIPASPNAMSYDYACIIQRGLDAYAITKADAAREKALEEAAQLVARCYPELYELPLKIRAIQQNALNSKTQIPPADEVTP